MQLSVVTLFPEMFSALTNWGISGRAVKRELITLDFFNPRSFATDKQRTVDDKPVSYTHLTLPTNREV